MYGSNFDSAQYPRLGSFAKAKEYYESTTPMHGGNYPGRIPLRCDRSRPGHYWMSSDRRRHALLRDKDEPVEAYICNMYYTEIVVFYADGVIEISDYGSRTTCKVQNRLLGQDSGVSMSGDSKFLHISTREAACKTLMMPFQRNGDWASIPFGDGAMYLSRNKHGKVHVYNHGYLVRKGRTIHDPVLTKFVAAVRKQLRTISRMTPADSPDPLYFEPLPGEALNTYQRSGNDVAQRMADASQYLYQCIEKLGWKPGDRIRNSDLNLLLAPSYRDGSSECKTLAERFSVGCDLQALALWVQDGPTAEYSAECWVVDPQEADKLQALIEQAA